MRLFAISFLLAGAHAVQTGANAPRAPFSKIMKLLDNLMVEIQAQYDTEAKLCDNWTCWAQNLQGQKTQVAADADAQLMDMQGRIDSAAAAYGQLGGEIAEATADSEKYQTTIENAKTLRAKENTKHTEEVAKLADCVQQSRDASQALAKVGATGAAVNNIGELGYDTGSFLQAHTEIADKLKHLNIKDKNLDPDQLDALNSFLQGKTSNASLEQVAGMLRAIEEQCAKDLAYENEVEMNRQTSYLTLYESNTALLAAATEAANTKTSRQASELQRRVNAQNEMQDLQNIGRDARKILQQLEHDIPAKKSMCAQRGTDMMAEKNAIGEAVRALSDARSYVSLLEVASRTKDEKKEAARKEGVQKLSAIAEKDPNVAMIALQLQSKSFSFTKIIQLVADMIANVQKDEANAKAKYEHCEKSTYDLNNAADRLSDQGQTLESQIEIERSQQATLQGQIEDEDDQMKNNKNAAESATKQRAAENEEFRKAQDDAVKTNDLLGRAIQVLQAYYSGQNGAGEGVMGAVSTATGGFAFIQLHQPTNYAGFGVAATDSEFTTTTIEDLSGPYSGSAGTVQGTPSNLGEEPAGMPNSQWGGTKQGQAAITMLQEAINDSKAEMSARAAAEGEAQAEFDNLVAKLSESSMTSRDTKIELNMALAESQQKATQAEQAQKNHKKDTELNRAARLVNDKECSNLLATYLQRSQVRQQEVNSMNAVKAVLESYHDK